MALAAKENGEGHVFTVDNGSHWERIARHEALARLVGGEHLAYQDFLTHAAKQFELEKFLTFIDTSLPPFPELGVSIDLLFSDFRHDAQGILELLGFYLPLMSETSSIFIDSASTYRPSYHLLEQLTPQLNSGHVPSSLCKLAVAEHRDTLAARVRNSKFTLVHLTERKDRHQNSMAWIKIEPVDVLPHPVTLMREEATGKMVVGLRGALRDIESKES
jgi:hypothetical protein